MTFSSCNDWLDVSPRTEVKEDVLFSTEDGYKRALTGAYILMAKTNLYGGSTTMYMPELLVRHWVIPSSLPTGASPIQIYRFGNHQYTLEEAENYLNNIWINYYKVITQLNDIIKHLEDNTQAKFEFQNDKIIMGEAIGLRAFLHLDILRFFGPVPVGNNHSEIAIPYVTEKTKDAVKLISIPYSEVIKNIEDDLNRAEQLLSGVDPILKYNNMTLNYYQYPETNLDLQDNWRWKRQDRFNYYACLGTKARFYQWIGDINKATECAKRVIEAVNGDNTSKFVLAADPGENYNQVYAPGYNLTMYTEQLFGIHNPDMQNDIKSWFNDGTNSLLSQAQATMNSIYEWTTVGSSDIRYRTSSADTRYWELKTYSNGQLNQFKKFIGNDIIKTNNRVPLLRLAEMYLIMIENLPLEEAASYYSKFRIARAMDISTEQSSMASETARKNRVATEYRKDFFGEGQMFFFYKRLNYSTGIAPLNAVTFTNEKYVLPKPKNQISFE